MKQCLSTILVNAADMILSTEAMDLDRMRILLSPAGEAKGYTFNDVVFCSCQDSGLELVLNILLRHIKRQPLSS